MTPGKGTQENPLTMAEAMTWEFIEPGHTIHVTDGTYIGDFETALIPGVTIQAEGDHAVIDGSLKINSDDVTVIGLEILKSSWNRLTEIAGSDPADVPYCGFEVYGDGCIVRKCRIHDVKLVAFGSTSENLLFYGNVIYYIGWQGPDRGHGHTIYVQNDSPYKRIYNNIFFDPFGFNIHGYGGASSHLNNIDIRKTVCIRAGQLDSIETDADNILVGGEAGAEQYNTIIDHCMTYGDRPVDVGYHNNGSGITVTDNYVTNNINIDDNMTSVIFTGNSTEIVGNTSFVIPDDYINDYGFVVVYNEALSDNISVDISSILSVGDNYILRNVQDYFNDTLIGTVGLGGTISIDMRATSHTVSSPLGTNAPSTPPKMFPEFGCFVIEKV